MESVTLQKLSEHIMQQASEKGFGTKPEDIQVGEKIALIHSEISEAYDAYRRKKIRGRESFEEEMGDAIQRILHLCSILGVSVEESILEKIEYNKGRKWDWDKLNESHL